MKSLPWYLEKTVAKMITAESHILACLKLDFLLCVHLWKFEEWVLHFISAKVQWQLAWWWDEMFSVRARIFLLVLPWPRCREKQKKKSDFLIGYLTYKHSGNSRQLSPRNGSILLILEMFFSLKLRYFIKVHFRTGTAALGSQAPSELGDVYSCYVDVCLP
jgi:hypothetical protein